MSMCHKAKTSRKNTTLRCSVVLVMLRSTRGTAAPAHSSHLAQSFLAKHSTAVFHQAPSDMAPWDFWLFLEPKMPPERTT